jgi:hypothetical protein
MTMPGTTPPFVIPALLAVGVALAAIIGGPQEGRRVAVDADHPVTLYLPKATYDTLSKDGGDVPGIQDRATRLLVQAVGS